MDNNNYNRHEKYTEYYEHWMDLVRTMNKSYSDYITGLIKMMETNYQNFNKFFVKKGEDNNE